MLDLSSKNHCTTSLKNLQPHTCPTGESVDCLECDLVDYQSCIPAKSLVEVQEHSQDRIDGLYAFLYSRPPFFESPKAISILQTFE